MLVMMFGFMGCVFVWIWIFVCIFWVVGWIFSVVGVSVMKFGMLCRNWCVMVCSLIGLSLGIVIWLFIWCVFRCCRLVIFCYRLLRFYVIVGNWVFVCCLLLMIVVKFM